MLNACQGFTFKVQNVVLVKHIKSVPRVWMQNMSFPTCSELNFRNATRKGNLCKNSSVYESFPGILAEDSETPVLAEAEFILFHPNPEDHQ